MPDIAIPIVFPDYLIAVSTPKAKISIPDLLPGIDLLPDSVDIPGTNNKIPELGHAGIMFINGKSGLTKYYEYGRYGGPIGATRKIGISDVIITRSGHPTKDSLIYTLSQISSKAGQGGRIKAAYIEAPDQFSTMLEYAELRIKQNLQKSRKAYDLFTNSCNHFMKGVLEVANITLPYMLDPRPNSYIEEIRARHNDLDYARKDNSLKLESPPPTLAAVNYSRSQPAA